MTDIVPLDLNDLKTLKARWQRVGPILEGIRRREYLALTEEQRLARIADALSLADDYMVQRRSSGMVEMHRRLSQLCPR